jgi:hypothetical protein
VSTDRDALDERPGPIAWVVIAAGWVVIGVVVAGVLRESDRTHPGSWATWVLGAALVHDLVVLPLVLLTGLALGQLLRPSWRAPIRAALTVAVVLALVSWPTVRRFGARRDNSSILPLDAGRNLVVLVGILAVVALVAGGVRTARRRRAASAATVERGTDGHDGLDGQEDRPT